MSLEQEDSQEPLPPAPDCEDAAPPEWLEQLQERSEWGLGVILGPTGSGKTRALSTLKYAGLIDGVLRRTDVAATWPKDQAIISAARHRPSLVRRSQHAACLAPAIP